jgi:hypothetical protein
MALGLWVSVKQSSQLTNNCDGSLKLFTEVLCLAAKLVKGDEEGVKGWMKTYLKLMAVYIYICFLGRSWRERQERALLRGVRFQI